MVAVGLSDAAARGSGLASGLDCELLARRLAAGGLARGLLRASHSDLLFLSAAVGRGLG